MTPETATDATPAVTPTGDVTPSPAGEPSAALAVPEPGSHGELATADEWAELETFDDGSQKFREHFGLAVPRLRSDFGKNGQGWVDDLTGETIDHFNGVILAVPPTRQWWEKTIDEGGGGTPPECRSINMLTPTEDSPKKQSDSCITCPHAKWGETEDGRTVRPRCGEAINVLAYDGERDLFCWLRFGGTGIKPFKLYLSALASRRWKHYQLVTEITLRQEKDGILNWLVPEFHLGQQLTVEQVRPMRELAKMAMDSWATVAQEMATEARAHGEGQEGAGPFDGDQAGGTPKGKVDMGPGEEPF